MVVLDIKGFKESPKYQRKYGFFNKKYFENSLPYVTVGTAPLLKITKIPQKTLKNVTKDEAKYIDGGQYGLACRDEFGIKHIILDDSMCVYHKIIADQTLLHEMIHVYLGFVGEHGSKFKSQIRRIAALGALDNLI